MNNLTPRKALNKAFLQQKVYREEMERFKTPLLKMLHDKNEKMEAINRKVYELYGLSEEEIGIVEGSIYLISLKAV